MTTCKNVTRCLCRRHRPAVRTVDAALAHLVEDPRCVRRRVDVARRHAAELRAERHGDAGRALRARLRPATRRRVLERRRRQATDAPANRRVHRRNAAVAQLADPDPIHGPDVRRHRHRRRLARRQRVFQVR